MFKPVTLLIIKEATFKILKLKMALFEIEVYNLFLLGSKKFFNQSLTFSKFFEQNFL